ncbi:hypothetical protein BD560DRAFT_380234 [Blakeslea trispora]|nr:hypothetical protein BD560DRAFT_380234 [Blakeslea trispora]
MPTFSSKIGRVKTLKLSFKKKAETPTRPATEETEPYHDKITNTPEAILSSPTTTNNISFSETLKMISKQVNSTQFDDVFGSFFFNDKRCQHRALFMAARLKQTLDAVIHPIRPSSSYGVLCELSPSIVPSQSQSIPSKSTNTSASYDKPIMVDSFWRLVTHRLYTLNYILFVLPADSQMRADFLKRLESDLALKGDGKELERRGGMEAHFAVRYALEHRRKRRRKTLLEDAFAEERKNGGNIAGAVLTTGLDNEKNNANNNSIVEQARQTIEQCLESESKLSHSEKDAMYMFHAMRVGILGAFEPHIELEEDRSLRHRLKRLVDENKPTAPAYENPFEDEDLIVTEEDDVSSTENHSKEVDSGFYDGWSRTTVST